MKKLLAAILLSASVAWAQTTGPVSIPFGIKSLTRTTASGTIVEDASGGTPKVVTATSSATANTFGSWVEIDASTSANSWICSISAYTIERPYRCVLEVGKGAGGSETTIIRWSHGIDYITGVGVYGSNTFTVPIPIFVAAGTRLAVRMADAKASEQDMFISVQYYQGLE